MAGTTLAQGSSVTLTVAATDSILIDSAAAAQARIEAVSGVPGSANRQVIAFHPGGQRTYGPLGAGTVLLTAVTGAIQYRQGAAPLTDEGSFVSTATDEDGNFASLVDGNRNRIAIPYILGQGLDIAGSRTVTGTTTETSAYQLTIPANSMGAEGSLRISLMWGHTDSANNKTLRVKFGNSSPLVLTSITTTVDSNANTVVIQNMGATNSQEAHASLLAISTGTALITSAMDTTVDQLLEVTLQLASSGESVSLRRILVELIRP